MEILLTNGKVALVDEEDYARISEFRWGYDSKGYAITSVNNKTIRMHRLIMFASTDRDVDHVNGDGLDNRKENLRIVTRAENGKNKKMFKNNRSGYKGVYWHVRRLKWQACIRSEGKCIHLGYYSTKEEAAHVYNEAALKYHGEFARLNVIA